MGRGTRRLNQVQKLRLGVVLPEANVVLLTVVLQVCLQLLNAGLLAGWAAGGAPAAARAFLNQFEKILLCVFVREAEPSFPAVVLGVAMATSTTADLTETLA